MTVDIAVIGGGIAGLATAYELGKQGLSFVVLEQKARPGGVILSETIDGYTVDAGPDALLTQKPEGIRLCEELGLGSRLVATKPPRIAYIQRGNRLHALPAQSVLGIPTRVGPFIRTRLFSLSGKIRMGAELFVPPRRDPGDESIGSFIRRRFGSEAVTYLAEPLLAGIHAGDVDRLSVGALFPRFRDAERTHGSLLRAFRKQPASASPDGAFKSLPGGLSELANALAAALPVSSIRLNTAVTSLAVCGQPARRFRVDVASGATVEARALIVAAPAYVTAQLVRDIDRELAGLCERIPYASTATIALAFRRDQVAHPLNGSGFVVPRVERSGILAATWLSSKWPHRAPDDRALMRAFVGGARDPHMLERSDQELVHVALAALRPLLGISGEPLLTRVYRFERANAQHEVGHTARVEAIDRALARTPGLFVTGSGFRGVGIPDCVADARNTASRAATWLRDQHE